MRDAFLLDPNLTFLNHGSFGACPRDVFDVYQRWQLELERNPVEFLGRRSGELLESARAALALTLGCGADDLAFVPNSTHGVNIVARSLALQPGDEVLGTDHEYGACDAAWQFACRQRGATYRRVEIPLPFDARGFARRMLAAANARTRVIFASHISSTTALIFPVAELCRQARARGITTLIDGAHAPGQLALNLQALGADFYTGNCHKWMCAPKGAAFVHARPERQAELDAAVVSWGYVAGSDGASCSGGQPGFDAYTGSTLLQRRLQWQGTRDIAAYLAVPEAIRFQQRHGWPAWRQQCHALACQTRAQVAQRNGLPTIARDQDFGQMVPIPVQLPGQLGTDHTLAAEALRRTLFDDYRIEVPVTQHAGRSFVRLSVQAYNTQADMDRLISALADLGV